jgi:hypothetical protein
MVIRIVSLLSASCSFLSGTIQTGLLIFNGFRITKRGFAWVRNPVACAVYCAGISVRCGSKDDYLGMTACAKRTFADCDRRFAVARRCTTFATRGFLDRRSQFCVMPGSSTQSAGKPLFSGVLSAVYDHRATVISGPHKTRHILFRSAPIFFPARFYFFSEFWFKLWRVSTS